MIAGGAFRDRQFTRFFVGVFFAVQAIWVQRVTLAWLAWERTGSAGFVGLVAALGLAPTLVAGPFFGVMADRVDIRRAALTTNGIMAGILALLALSLPVVGAWGVAAAALAIGITSSAHHPVRMSLGPRLVGREMVQHVVSVTALNFNLARLVAPVLAGWMIASAGAGVALWVAVLCYIPMLVILPRLFATLVRGALEVLPVLADGAFGQGAAGLGMLTAAAGAGALVSAMLKAWGAGAAGASIPRSVLVAMFLGFAAVTGMGLAPVWPLALLATSLAGFTATWCGVSLQAAIQTDLPDAYRGRVMSLWTVVGVGAVAIGAGLIGALAELFGIGPALVIAGCIGLFGTALWRIGGARG